MVAPSKALVYGRSPAEMWVRIPLGAWMSVVCCQVEVSATRWSRVQRSPTDCNASLCVIQKPQEWEGYGPRWAAAPQGKKNGVIGWVVCSSQIRRAIFGTVVETVTGEPFANFDSVRQV